MNRLLRMRPGPFLIGCFLLFTAYLVVDGNWQRSRFPLQMDANGYYIYLPAVFIYNDLETLSFVDRMPEQFDRKYFLYPGAHGGYMTKYTPGMAILELPFFALGHGLAMAGGWATDGYSPPYRLAIAVSSAFYSLLGLWFLGKVLAAYFRPATVLLTLALVLFGTNLLFYSVVQVATTHNYVFFVLCLMLAFLERWKRRSRWQDFGLACACVGFATLIRPTEVLTGMIPVGYALATMLEKKDGLVSGLVRFRKEIPAGILGFGLFLFPVFAYWKFSTGNWVAYTYEQEGFYFDRPWQIWLGLFGFRKGWFIYTPMLFLSLAGLMSLWKDPRYRAFRTALLAYMPINLYIVLSWYGWWYGGCFGLRALVPALGIMAIPLAFLMEKLWAKPLRFFVAAGFFTLLNLFQSFQYQRQILHMDAMTWRAYLYVFGKWRLTDAEKAELRPLLDYPDYGQRGKKLDEYFR